MSIDHFYLCLDGKFSGLDRKFVEDVEAEAGFWVDICHGGGMLVDERYIFSDFKSALHFYLEGYKGRLYVIDGKEMGLDHAGIYAHGRLIHGMSIHMDLPGHEGENARELAEKVARAIDGRFA